MEREPPKEDFKPTDQEEIVNDDSYYSDDDGKGFNDDKLLIISLSDE